jgi:3-oxoacyl-[acyl-carrier protein] reductase
MLREFKDKIVVITGASTGIGRAMGVEFAKAGATVMLTSRNKTKLQETAKIIKKNGGKAEIFTADLRDIKAIQKFAKLVKSKWNRVDVIVNVAGVYHSDKKAYYKIDFINYKLDEILTTLEVGIIAPAILCHELLPMMKRNSKIVNISGTFESGAKGWLPYYVSKKALEDLTIGLCQELADKQIQVNCVSPSDTLTESYKKFFPKYATPENCVMPEKVAHKVMLFASESNHDTGKIVIVKR